MKPSRGIVALLICSIGLNLVSIGFIVGVGRPPVWMMPLITLVTFLFAVLHAGGSLGWQRGFLLLALVTGAGLAFESVGVATGAVYGPYHYSNTLGPKFLNLVPYLIPVAWFMMIYPSFRIADDLATQWIPRGFWRGLSTAALGALIMTAWDLAMDPLMAAAGHWVWEKEGAYFGVPVQNFWGWWLTTFTALGLYLIIRKAVRGNNEPSLSSRLPILAYASMGASTILVDFLSGLSGPGLVGIFAMLPWIVAGMMGSRSVK